ncbi:MAG: secondary thiamine-phosphate synthase enzyme YjbQ [Bacteroidia bacterium]
MITQHEFILPPHPRGFHIITRQVEEALPPLPQAGLLHVFIKHTSAGLALNENADPSVRRDFENSFNHLVPEDEPYYTHTMEGSDDMPAHIKAALTGSSITVPVFRGRLNLGTWQGIYLCEFRNHGGPRNIVLTLIS